MEEGGGQDIWVRCDTNVDMFAIHSEQMQAKNIYIYSAHAGLTLTQKMQYKSITMGYILTAFKSPQ